MTHRQETKQAALAFLIVLAPFVLLGTVLTISLFGAVFGLPLLFATVPPAVVAWRLRSSPTDSQRLHRLTVCAFVVACVLTVALVGFSAVGIEDLDAAGEWALFVLAVGWLAWSWWVAARLRALRATR